MAEAEQGQRHFRRGIIKMMCLTDKLSPHYSPFDRWRVCGAEGRDVSGEGERNRRLHIPQGETMSN